MHKFIFLFLFISCLGFSQSERPNVLFVISDDQSAMHAGAYGDIATKTPALDRIARGGVLFKHAFTAAPSCAPSQSAILTGRNIWELEEGGVLLGILRSKFTVSSTCLKVQGTNLERRARHGGQEGWKAGSVRYSAIR